MAVQRDEDLHGTWKTVKDEKHTEVWPVMLQQMKLHLINYRGQRQ